MTPTYAGPMTTLRSMLGLALHPERRRPATLPLQVDLRRVILVGLAAWSVAVVVYVVLGAVGWGETHRQLWVCAGGIALGLVGLLWERTNRRSYRAAAETVEVDDVVASAPPRAD